MCSTRTLVTLLRPWIRRFTIIISAWWLRTSSKFTWEEVKTPTGKLGKWSTPKRVRIRPKHSAPSLSRDRRIKMHQSINHHQGMFQYHIMVCCCGGSRNDVIIAWRLTRNITLFLRKWFDKSFRCHNWIREHSNITIMMGCRGSQ